AGPEYGMMLPILISVAVAPGSYFLVCASALPASAVASSAANTTFPGIPLRSLGTRACIVVLPEATTRFCPGSVPSRRTECAISMHDWNRVGSNCFFRGAEVWTRCSSGVASARTVKRGCCKARMIPALRTKVLIHEPGAKGALVHRKPSRRAPDARRDLERRGHLALSHGAGVCGRDRLFGDPLCACPPPLRGGACAGGRRA